MNNKANTSGGAEADGLEQSFRALIDQARREGYATGFNAALNGIKSAIADMGGDIPENMSIAMTSSPGREALPKGAPTAGTTPYYVYVTLRNRQGLSGAEIVSLVHEAGHKASEASIRTSILRLKARKLIVQRHGKWFLP